jgi:hypothetical protein
MVREAFEAFRNSIAFLCNSNVPVVSNVFRYFHPFDERTFVLLYNKASTLC